MVKELLRLYKYERLMSAHTEIAAVMSDTLPYLPDHVIIAVPTATTRRRQRGYDHALLLAKEIGRLKNMTYCTPVVRLSQARQVGATRKARFAQLQNSFAIIRPQQIQGKKVLLIDDVVTTGATLETLADLLKKNGAQEVSALVFAQKL